MESHVRPSLRVRKSLNGVSGFLDRSQQLPLSGAMGCIHTKEVILKDEKIVGALAGALALRCNDCRVCDFVCTQMVGSSAV